MLPTPADDRARVRQWRVDLERWRNLLIELYADGVIETLEEVVDLARANPADLAAERFYESFNDVQLATMVRALASGARPEELLALGVCGLNCDGEDLLAITDE